MKKALLLLLISSFLVPSFAEAIKLNLNYPNFGPFNPETNQNLSEIIGYLYYFIVGIAGLAAFVMLVWGGVQWLVSGAIPSQASEARDKIRNAILGLLLILASFLIVQIINPELTILRSNLEDIDQQLWGSVFGKPREATLAGVYLCKKENCAGGPNEWIRIMPGLGKDTSCRDFDNLNSIPVQCTPEGNLGINWASETRAIRFAHPLAGKQWDVRLFSATGYSGRVMCPREYGSDNLGLHELDFDSEVGWAKEVKSLAISELDRGAIALDYLCSIPGFTFEIPMMGFPPAVAFFHKQNYAATQDRVLGLPLEVRNQVGKEPLSAEEGEYRVARVDQYGENRIPPPNVASLWVSDARACGKDMGSGQQSEEFCAVRLWESTDMDPETDASVCFTKPESDLLRPDPANPDYAMYAFDCTDPGNDIRNDIEAVQVIPASECTLPAVVIDPDCL